MEFKDKVLFVRGKLLLTQEELAKEVGCSFASINRWETGKKLPTFLLEKKFEKFCERHGIKFDNDNNR